MEGVADVPRSVRGKHWRFIRTWRLTALVLTLSAIVLAAILSTALQSYVWSFDALLKQVSARLTESTRRLASTVELRMSITGRHRALASIRPGDVASISSPIQLNNPRLDGMMHWTSLPNTDGGYTLSASVFKTKPDGENFLYVYIETPSPTFARRAQRPGWLTDSDYFVVRYASTAVQTKYWLVAFEDRRDQAIVARVAAFVSNSELVPKVEESTVRDSSLAGGLYDRTTERGGYSVLLRIPLLDLQASDASVAIGVGAKVQGEKYYASLPANAPVEFANSVCDAIERGAPYPRDQSIESAYVVPSSDPDRKCSVGLGHAAVTQSSMSAAYIAAHEVLMGIYVGAASALGIHDGPGDGALSAEAPIHDGNIQVGRITAERTREALLEEWKPFFRSQLINATISLVGLMLLVAVFYFSVLRRIGGLSRAVLRALKERSRTIGAESAAKVDEIGVLARTLRLWARQAEVQAARVSARNLMLAAQSAEIEQRNEALARQAAALADKSAEIAARNRELELSNERHKRIAKQIRHDIHGNLIVLKNYNIDLPRARELLETITRTTEDILIERDTALETVRTDITEFLGEWIENMTAERHISGLRFIAGEKGIVAFADANRLGEVLLHLLNNALDFRDMGTEVCVSASRLGDGARICVANIGDPIQVDDIERIFSHGVSIRKSPSSINIGSGLHKARQYVSGMGGTIFARNGAGRRVEFLIDLK